jgi:Protein of unknown function (DUF3306)
MTERTVPDEGFLRRWARRKTESRTAEAPVEEVLRAPTPGAASSAHAASASVFVPGDSTAAADGSAPSTPVQLPTLDDAARLTPDADFSAFVARGVDAAVRRTALKKLFADPHFNAMDGLDVYIGDYTQPSPVSDAMLASLAHARQVLRRTVDPDTDTDADADADAPPDAATHVQRQQSPEPGHDEHPPARHTDDA